MEFIESTDERLLQEAAYIVSESEVLGKDLGNVVQSMKQAEPEALKDEYTRLFIGPGSLQAPPWESAYVSKEKLLFTTDTQAVRNYYRGAGLMCEAYPHVADDHIALELDFLRALGESEIEYRGAGDERMFWKAIQYQQDFLRDHLLKWVGLYEKALAAAAPTSPYAACVAALVLFVEMDYKKLEVMHI